MEAITEEDIGHMGIIDSDGDFLDQNGVKKLKVGYRSKPFSGYLCILRPIMQEKIGENTSNKPLEEVAREVIAGKWGNGSDRKDRLNKAGYNYGEVQNKVNEILSNDNKKTVEEIAKEVIAGKWGNGIDRKNKLNQAGYNYDEVQNKVNQILK